MGNNAGMLSYKVEKYNSEIKKFCAKCNRVYLYGKKEMIKNFADYLSYFLIKIDGIIIDNDEKNNFSITPVFLLSEIAFADNDGIILVAEYPHERIELKSYLENNFRLSNIYIQKKYSAFAVPINHFITDKAQLEEYKNSYFAQYTLLNDLGEKNGTDKSKLVHNYLNKYEFFLKQWYRRKFTLLELGISAGASLKTWGEYFPDARIVGVDIVKECKMYAGNNRRVLISDLSKESNIIRLRKLNPEIIIDDASHFWSHQIIALFLLFSVLPHGGIYIIEDIETSFVHAGFEGFNDAIVSTYEICSKIAEVATSMTPLTMSGHFNKEIEEIGMQVEMISFIKGSCIIIKK